MKYFFIILTGIVLCYAGLHYFPWWIFAPVNFILFLMFRTKTGFQSFITGFFIVWITWVVLYFIADIKNDSVLSSKMAGVFSMPNHVIFLILSAIIIAIPGGFCALTAYSITHMKGKKTERQKL